MTTFNQDFISHFDTLREASPLIHCITNYVTVSFVANALLACGASPVMSDDIEDAPSITAISQGLTINIGTLNATTIQAMHASGRRANELDLPILLDPVGAGATTLRTQTVVDLTDSLSIACIRGNVSEIKALAGAAHATRGVDANPEDKVTRENLSMMAAYAHELARKTDCIIAMTGAIDIVAR